jgi:AAA domain
MQQQKTRHAGPKPKFNWKRIVRIMLIALMLLAGIATGIIAISMGGLSLSAILGGLSTLIFAFAAIVVPILISTQPATTSQAAMQPGATPSIVTQSVTMSQAAMPPVTPQPTVLQSSGNTSPAVPNDVQSGNVAQSTGVKTGQPIFFFNLGLDDPNEFYGHKAVRRRLIDYTARGGSSSIVGGRRVGKTWLLEYLQLVAHNELGPYYRIGLVSAIDTQCENLAGFVQWALTELEVPPSSYDPSLPPLGRLSQGVRALRKGGIIPVLCIDEFEGFRSNGREFNVYFFERLRALAQRKKDRLILVTASRRPLGELIGDLIGQNSPLFNIVELVSLHPFTKQEASDFVRDKSDMAGFTKKESDFFLNQSMLHDMNGELYWPPLLLQCVGQLLLDDKQDAQGQPLDDQLDTFSYQSNFKRRLDEKYQAVV